MTMPDNANDVGEQQHPPQDDEAGQTDPTTGDDTGATDGNQDDAKIGNEAARYRRRLREAERERDELRDTLAKTRQSIVDNAVAAAGLNPRLMVAAGHTLDTLVGDDGLIDHGKLSEAITNTAQEFNVAPKGRPPQPNPQQGRPGPPAKSEASWSSALKGSRD